ncbi:MAG: hypothetical protein KKB74_09715, partial [Bacteroidetes bacterium]|nr:hypothetical protein [Bacteroidota bacterium]
SRVGDGEDGWGGSSSLSRPLVMQLWTIIDQTAYVLSYGAMESTYDDFEEDAKSIIDSFEFL